MTPTPIVTLGSKMPSNSATPETARVVETAALTVSFFSRKACKRVTTTTCKEQTKQAY